MLRDAAIEMGILITVDLLRSWSGEGQVAKLREDARLKQLLVIELR